MIVVDASTLTNALTDDGPLGVRARSELAQEWRWAAPAHLVVEVFSAVRGRVRGGGVAEQRAVDALAALDALVLDLVDVRPLLPRMWALRANVSGYDAAYVALAEAQRCPLLTADARLARVPGLRCEVRLAGAG